MSQFEHQRWVKEGWGGFLTYAHQVTIYWDADGYKECLYVVKNRSSGFTEKNYLIKPPADIDEIMQHVTDVERWVRKHGTVMEGQYDPKSVECKRCRFATVLGCADKGVVPKTGTVEGLEVARKLWWQGKNM